MAIGIRGSGVAGSGGTGNLAVVSSAAPVAGDLILIFVNVNNTSSGSHPTPACTGFTSLGSSTASVWSRTSCLGKIAAGSEGTSFTVSGFAGADSKEIAVVVLSGVGASLPTNIVTTPDASSNTTWSIPAITTAANNSLDVACVGFGGNNNAATSSNNLSSWGSSLVEVLDAASSAGPNYAGLGVATVIRATAGVQAATSVTSTVSDVSAAIRIEVLEASAGGTQYTQSASGAITPSGVTVKQDQKPLAGSMGSAGAIVKQAQKVLAGAITPIAALIKRTFNTLSGAITPTGATIRTFQRSIVGASSAHSVLRVQTNKVLTGQLTSVGMLVKYSFVTLSGSVDFAATSTGIKTALIALTGSLNLAGSLTKATTHFFTGTISYGGVVVKLTGKLTVGAITSSGAITAIKAALISLTGTLTTSGAIIKRSSTSFVGVLSTSGGVIRSTIKRLVGAIGSSGTAQAVKAALIAFGGTLSSSAQLLRQTGKQIAGSLPSASSLARLTGKATAGATSASGVLSRVTAKTLLASLTVVGDLGRTFAKLLAGSVTSTSALTKAIAKQLVGGLSISGIISASGGTIIDIVGRIRVTITSAKSSVLFTGRKGNDQFSGRKPTIDVEDQ